MIGCHRGRFSICWGCSLVGIGVLKPSTEVDLYPPSSACWFGKAKSCDERRKEYDYLWEVGRRGRDLEVKLSQGGQIETTFVAGEQTVIRGGQITVSVQ